MLPERLKLPNCGPNAIALRGDSTCASNLLNVPVVRTATASEYIDARVLPPQFRVLAPQLDGIAGVEVGCLVELCVAAP